MNNIIRCVFLFGLLLDLIHAFHTTFPVGHSIHTSIQMGGFFDFDRLHGSGSAGKEDLDAQWELQQKILAERRDHMDKKHLKKKYNTPQKLELGGNENKQAAKKVDITDDMIVDEPKGKKKAPANANASAPKFKMPWEK